MKEPQSEISMIPLAQSSAPVRNLVDYWNEARLHAASAKSSSVRPAPGIVPWRAALEDVLKVGYGVQAQPRFLAGAWQQVRWRTTPSAGALYPFEVIVSVVGEGSYLWEIERGRLVPFDARPLTREGLAEAGLAMRPGHRVEALLTFVARPWLSMKKYRLRGYAYCHLDVGHTATNLALYTAALGHDSVLHLRFSRTSLAEHLRLEGLCREPLAVLSFTSIETGTELAPPVPDPDAGIPPIGLDLPGEQEIRAWEELQGIFSFDVAVEPPCDPASAALLAAGPGSTPASLLPLPDGRPPLGPAAEWRSAILSRRSAKGFRPEPVSVAAIGELLAAFRGTGLPSDCSLDELSAQMGVRLVARNVDGLSGVYAYAPEAHALQQIDPRADDPRPACMQQGLAGNAAALLILHAPFCRLVQRHGFSAFAELQFRAAELGQRLHLAATRLGLLGITCIGGFDGEECAALARLGADEETVYVILVGIRDESVFKYDQLNVAFSHGHTTTLED
jgi:SagB-type dehydrogenase family enzyme